MTIRMGVSRVITMWIRVVARHQTHRRRASKAFTTFVPAGTIGRLGKLRAIARSQALQCRQGAAPQAQPKGRH